MSNGKEAFCAPLAEGGINSPPDPAPVLPSVVVPAKVLPVVLVKLFAAFNSATLVDRRASARVPVETLLAFKAVRLAPLPLKLLAVTLPVNTLFVPNCANAEEDRPPRVAAFTLLKPAPLPLNALAALLKV